MCVIRTAGHIQHEVCSNHHIPDGETAFGTCVVILNLEAETLNPKAGGETLQCVVCWSKDTAHLPCNIGS